MSLLGGSTGALLEICSLVYKEVATVLKGTKNYKNYQPRFIGFGIFQVVLGT
jgi:hypothetical protein